MGCGLSTDSDDSYYDIWSNIIQIPNSNNNLPLNKSAESIINSGNIKGAGFNSDNVTSNSFPIQNIVLNEPEYRSGNIHWDDIKKNQFIPENEASIGSGGFGAVVKALWKYESNVSNNYVEVALKIVTRDQVHSDNDYKNLVKKMINQVTIIQQTKDKIIFKNCIIHVYGISQGKIPVALSSLFQLSRDEEGVGIIMRLEKGGNLKSLIHPVTPIEKSLKLQQPLTMKDKINIIFQLARAIAELHSVGILHGDIKPENVLFSSPICQFPESYLRLADFGYAKVKDILIHNNSLSSTKNHYGTMYYNPPEMFRNPRGNLEDRQHNSKNTTLHNHLNNDSENDNENHNHNEKKNEKNTTGKIASVSRKTDMYSFAIVLWEILAEQQAFQHIHTESSLSAHLWRNRREDMNKLPMDTPTILTMIITHCWDGDRKQRKSAIECTVLLHPLYLYFSNVKYIDVLIQLKHISLPTNVMNLIFYYFIRHGLTVMYDNDDDNTTITTTNGNTKKYTSTQLNEIKNNHRVKIMSGISKNQLISEFQPTVSRTRHEANTTHNSMLLTKNHQQQEGEEKESELKTTSSSSVVTSFELDITFLWNLIDEVTSSSSSSSSLANNNNNSTSNNSDGEKSVAVILGTEELENTLLASSSSSSSSSSSNSSSSNTSSVSYVNCMDDCFKPVINRLLRL